MTPNDAALPQVYLKSGEIVFLDSPHVVLTVLGSCLSVTLFHRKSRMSAISHGLLPHCREQAGCAAGSCREMGKYVECSFVWMLKRFQEAGASRGDIEVKVFGGADMFVRLSGEKAPISVGKQNIAAAQKIIEREGLTVLSLDVGGSQGRKIFFHTGTGDVMLKRLAQTIILAEPAEGKNGSTGGGSRK